MHQLVYVIGEDVYEQLEQYSEHLEERKEYVSDYDLELMKKFYKTNDLEELRQACHDYFGGQGEIDAKGLFYWNDTNPNAMFDWYEEGGRWEGNLLLKNGTRSNSALIKDIDWKKMITRQYKHYLSNYKEYNSPSNKLKRITDPSFGNQYDIYKEENKDEYLERNVRVSPCSWVIDYEWYELNPKIKEKEFRKLITNLDENERISVIDSHY